MIYVSTYEAYWCGSQSNVTHGHYEGAEFMSFEAVLSEFVQNAASGTGIIVRTIDADKVIITSPYGMFGRSKSPSGVGSDGYSTIFAYHGSDKLGVDGKYGFELFVNTVWAYLHRHPEMRSGRVQFQMDKLETRQAA